MHALVRCSVGKCSAINLVSACASKEGGDHKTNTLFVSLPPAAGSVCVQSMQRDVKPKDADMRRPLQVLTYKLADYRIRFQVHGLLSLPPSVRRILQVLWARLREFCGAWVCKYLRLPHERTISIGVPGQKQFAGAEVGSGTKTAPAEREPDGQGSFPARLENWPIQDGDALQDPQESQGVGVFAQGPTAST